VVQEDSITKVPPCPVSGNPVFKKWWNRYCEDLIRVGVLTARDLAAVEMLCSAHASLERVTEVLTEAEENGSLYLMTDNGSYSKHPGLGEAAGLRKTIESYQHKLGLDPTARIRITPKVPQDKVKGKVAGLNRKGS
jgi:P27 family predicted phage terminase small subunit